MNAVDAGRNELAHLGLRPGARHPNVADSTPVQNEDSTIFYDYWTFNKPTVIETSKTGHPIEVTVCTSATNGDEQTISIMGETACREYLRNAVFWKSETADLIRHDNAHRQIMAHIVKLAEGNPPLAAWVLEHAPTIDVDTEDLTLTLFDLYDDPMINLHTSTTAGGGWAKLPEQTIDNLDNIITSLEFSRLHYMAGMQRESLAEFLTTLSDNLDKAHYDALHAPGVPTLAEALEAANEAHSVVEAGRQELARLGFAVPKPETTRYPPELLDNGKVLFYGYKCFDSFAHIVTDVRGRIVEVYAGEPPMVIDDHWEAELTGEIACQEFLRCAAEWKSPQVTKARETIARESVLSVLDSLAEHEPALAPWVNEQDPLIEMETDSLTVTLTSSTGKPLIMLCTSTEAGDGWARIPVRPLIDNNVSWYDIDDVMSSPEFADLHAEAGTSASDFKSIVRAVTGTLGTIHTTAMCAAGPTLRTAARAAQDTQQVAELKAQRATIPSEMLGMSVPQTAIHVPSATSAPAVAPTSTIHQAEGRSL